jgi:dTDP-4-amino-4,6-dideoxygalactose transaminase
MTHHSYIPFHRPSIGDDEIAAVTRVLASGWLTTGPVALQFENEFAAYIGCKHALAVNSGTAALQLALDAIGLRQDEEVLLPTYTFTATAEVVTYFGARPVLCDSVPGGFNIDPDDVERKITEKTRAIIAVHIGGEVSDLDALQQLADRYHLHLIEDAAHALPSSHHSKRIGNVSELTAFSFYATKTLTTAEGGMLTTNNDVYAERAKTMRLHGILGDAWKRYSQAGTWYYEVHHAGYKMNLCDLLAALGRAQLKRCEQFAQRRREISEYYTSRFSRLAEVELPPVPQNCSQHAWHLYILRIRPGVLEINRDQFIQQLKDAGIGTSVHFIPLHLQPFYAAAHGYKRGEFPHAEDAFSRCLSLPIYSELRPEEMHRVAAAVEHCIERGRRKTLVAV